LLKLVIAELDFVIEHLPLVALAVLFQEPKLGFTGAGAVEEK